MSTLVPLKIKESRASTGTQRSSTRSSFSKNRFDSPSLLPYTPVSYCRIKFFQYNFDDSFLSKSPRTKLTTATIERELYVNLNCSIRILMEYIRNEANIPETMNFDLFDEMGNMKHTFNVQPQTSATNILLQNAVYFIVVILKHETGVSMKPYLLINRGARLNVDYLNRIRRQIQSKKYPKFASAS